MARDLAARMNIACRWIATLAIAVMLAACNKPATRTPDSPPGDLDTSIALLNTMTREANSDTQAKVTLLQDAVKTFLATPSDENQKALQQAWLAAHNAFSATRALLLENHDELVFSIDAWPIQPGFLDSLPGYPDSGIVNDLTLDISSKVLEQQNGITDTEEVSLGFHPLEYYAFSRPVGDFVPDTSSATGVAITRRRALVSLIATTLGDSLKQLDESMADDLLELRAARQSGKQSDNVVLARIVAGFQHSAHNEFQEASLLVDKSEEHCRFSHSSTETLATEMRTVRAIFATKGDLMQLLRQVDSATADNLDKTLDQVKGILDKGTLTDTDKAKLPLLLSAINHQFEDFERKLPEVTNGA